MMDPGGSASPGRPHRDPHLIGLVFLGGTIGTAARAALEPFQSAGAWPWVTLGINVSGSFLLGLLLELLARRDARVGPGRAARLLLGTGVLGGYTTYATFAVETVHLPLVGALLYAGLTVCLGLAAASAGFRLGRVRVGRGRQGPGRENDPIPAGGA